MVVMVASSEDPALEKLRAICTALPEAIEKETWETQTFRVRDKIFAMRSNHEGRIALWCKAPAGAQEVLVGSAPETFFVPPYVGHKGWIGVRLDRDDTDWDEIKGLVIESYLITAPKRLAALVDQNE
jgi:predicted DNA-binding protein (MmcQ/YjbR family)